MFGSAMLEVVIGLVLAYLLLGLACSTLNELAARVFRLRATALRNGIRQLLGDSAGERISRELYQHPLITGLTGGLESRHGPTWIDPQIFSSALLHVAGLGASGVGDSVDNTRRAIERIKDDHLRGALQALLISVESKGTRLQSEVEAWFNSAMTQVTEWYKRRTQWVILSFSLVICFALNVDTIAIVRTLSADPVTRAKAVAAAEAVSERGSLEGETLGELRELMRSAENSGLPIGWKKGGGARDWPGNAQDRAMKLLGILLSVISVSLGAPFWFDVLNKLLRLRGGGGAERT